MYATLYRTMRALWPGGLATRRKLQELERSQWLSAADFQALQLQKLQAIVEHAYNNTPFYQKLYKSYDIHPQDIKSLADFQALPFVTKTQIRENLDDMLARNIPRERLESNHTGGSTGEPLLFYITDDFWWGNAANEFRARRWRGFEEGDKMAWLWGDQRDTPNWSKKRRWRAKIMNQRFLNAFSLTEAKMQEFAEMLLNWQPKLIKGYATTLSLFAQFLKEKNITGIRPLFVESTAEKLWPPQRALIEEVFQCQVANSYSSREMGMMAYQCEHGTQHLLDDMRFVEIIAKGTPAPPGTLGEVAVTSFDHFALPFIRYKNDDMAIGSANRCACGRSLSAVQEIVGRTNDYLVAANGQFVHSEFFAYLLRAKPEVFSYQIHQPDKEHLRVKIVCNRPVVSEWRVEIQRQIQERFGPAMNISLELVDNIPLTPAGKHRYIISDIEPDFN